MIHMNVTVQRHLTDSIATVIEYLCIKIKYCDIQIVCILSLVGAFPCLKDRTGVETLKRNKCYSPQSFNAINLLLDNIQTLLIWAYHVRRKENIDGVVNMKRKGHLGIKISFSLNRVRGTQHFSSNHTGTCLMSQNFYSLYIYYYRKTFSGKPLFWDICIG